MNGMDWESMKHRTIHTGKDRGIFYFTHPNFPNEHRLDKSYIANAEDGRACIQAAQPEEKDSRLVYNRNQQFEMRP